MRGSDASSEDYCNGDYEDPRVVGDTSHGDVPSVPTSMIGQRMCSSPRVVLDERRREILVRLHGKEVQTFMTSAYSVGVE